MRSVSVRALVGAAVVAFGLPATAVAATPQPIGDPGNWTLKFDDEFSGTKLDTSRWIALQGYKTNEVTTEASNVSESGGYLMLKLSSKTQGAEIDSAPYDGAGPNGYLFPVGGFLEARIDFAGSGATVDNWPAFWASGQDWPYNGEEDIAEGLGTMTTNYHYEGPSGPAALNSGTIPGTWAGGFHTYGIYRGAKSITIYYDGKSLGSYASSDEGGGQAILLNIGVGQGPTVTGTAGEVKVDYVRAWQ